MNAADNDIFSFDNSRDEQTAQYPDASDSQAKPSDHASAEADSGDDIATPVAKGKASDYDESSIQTLEWNEHIRRRPGMYIGKLGDGSHAEDGIYVLVKEAVDNSEAGF